MYIFCIPYELPYFPVFLVIHFRILSIRPGLQTRMVFHSNRHKKFALLNVLSIHYWMFLSLMFRLQLNKIIFRVLIHKYFSSKAKEKKCEKKLLNIAYQEGEISHSSLCRNISYILKEKHWKGNHILKLT